MWNTIGPIAIWGLIFIAGFGMGQCSKDYQAISRLSAECAVDFFVPNSLKTPLPGGER